MDLFEFCAFRSVETDCEALMDRPREEKTVEFFSSVYHTITGTVYHAVFDLYTIFNMCWFCKKWLYPYSKDFKQKSWKFHVSNTSSQVYEVGQFCIFVLRSPLKWAVHLVLFFQHQIWCLRKAEFYKLLTSWDGKLLISHQAAAVPTAPVLPWNSRAVRNVF